MTFLEVLKRIDECKDKIALGGGPSFQRPDGYDVANKQIWRELNSYDDSDAIAPADIFCNRLGGMLNNDPKR